MRRRMLSEIAAVVGGVLAGDDRPVDAVAIDSREVAPGDLFVALRGDRVDGHDYLPQAFEAGAAGAIVDGPLEGHPSLVVVRDTARALLDLATDEREAMRARVVGITGSTGKTTVKDMTAAVLATRMSVHASPRSFNTEIGVPVTLLSAPEGIDAIVCEMGSRGIGHIELLVSVARPTVGVVTNVGPAHLEMFGSAEGVARAKGELVEGLPENGTAVLNADDPVVRGFADRTAARVLRYGLAADAEVRAEDLALDEAGRASFTLRTPAGSERVELALHGEHMVANALAAAGAGVALGLSAGECAAGLKDARLSAWRMEVSETPRGIRVVNDAYNANPTSMAAAFKAASWMARGSRCIVVLGPMAELGEASDEAHERVGELLARLGIAEVITVGDDARRIAVGATREGVEPDRVTMCDTREEALAAVRRVARSGDVVLVKGSRVAGLEWVASALHEEDPS